MKERLDQPTALCPAAKPAAPQRESKQGRDEILEEILKAAGLEALD